MLLSHSRRFAAPIILVLALALAIAVFAIGAKDSHAVIYGFKTYKTSINVNLGLIEHTKWNGERSGCFAPYEKWDSRYNIDIDSKPKRRSKIIKGVATVNPMLEGGTATTPSYGDKGSFKQRGSDASWELTTQNTGDCPTAPPVPDWATSPTCRKISERVSATLMETETAGTARGDGILQIMRVRRAKPRPTGASIGASCYRTLHDLYTSYYDANVGITVNSTILTIPVPNMVDKLNDLAGGGARKKPSFRIKIRFSASCNDFGVWPRTGQDTTWQKSPFTQPHQFLGSFNGEAERSVCTLNGSGSAVVRRESRVVRR